MSLFNHFRKHRRIVKSSQLSRRVQLYPWRLLLFFLLAAVVIPGTVPFVRAAVGIVATKTDAFIGGDGDGQADPGETIEYTVVVTNSGTVPVTDDASGVTFNDTIDANTTLVSGSLAASPVAVNDTFPVTVVGNVSINSAALASPFSVTANDFLGLNPAATISSFQATSLNGGQVAMTTSGAGMGQFTYNPPPGFEGADSFTYTLTDNATASSPAANRTATVSITVSGMVWFINNTGPACTTLAAGCGRLSNPFSTLAAFNALNNGSGNNPAANDNIFIYESGPAYTGGVTLLSGQRLIGQDATQSLSLITSLTPPTGSPAFPAMNTGAPATTIQNGTGDAITINEGNTIRGLTISGTSGAGIVGVNRNSLTVGADVATSGVSGADLSLNGGNGTVSFGANVSNTAGRSISIINRTGGTATLTGPINDTGTGVLLDNNDNATVTIAGGLVVNSGTNAAFTATNGGTVNVCDENPCNPAATGALVNTLTTTTGTALNVANTNIGANRLEFRSISANGASSGIVLNSTGSSGGLIVKGNGNTAVGGNSSGGTIQNTTSHGVSLINTQNPSFTNLNIQNSADSGIFGSQVVNFTFDNGTINNSGTSLGAFDSNIAFSDGGVTTLTSFVSGIVTITDSILTLGYYDGVDIQNFVGTISDLNISNNIITSSPSTASSKAPGIRVIAFGTGSGVASVTRATIDGNTITNFPSDSGIMFQCGNANSEASPSSTCGSGGTNLINITDNIISGQSAANRIGTQGILFNVNGVGTGNFNVSNNTITNTAGNSISHNVFGDAVVTSVINGNTIVKGDAPNTLATSGIVGGTSNTGGFATNTPRLTVLIRNNTISQTDGNGILMVSRDLATGQLNISIKQNNVAAPLGGVRPGIRVDAGNASGDNDVCLDIGGVVAGDQNTSSGSSGSPGIGLRKQGTSTTVNAFGIEGLPADGSPNIENYINSRNPAGSGTLLISASTGFTNCSSAPVGMLAPNRHLAVAQNQAEINPMVDGTQANSPALNPAERFNTPLGDTGMVKQAAWVVPQAEAVKVIPALFTDNPGGDSVKKLVPPLAPAQSGETVNVAIGRLPASKSVIIRFRVTVDNPLPLGKTQISNQGTVGSNELAGVLTDDPSVGGASNPTLTPVDRPDTSVTSITRQSANPTNASTVTWQIVFAHPVASLTAGNFSLVQAAGVSGASITGVTETSGPPSTTWNITANTGTGDGTLGLNLVNDTGLSHDVTNLTFTGQVYTVDKTAPTVTNVTSSTADGFYNAPDVISLQVVFNEGVTVTGTPQLTLETGPTDRVVAYSSGSGTNTLTFEYTVQVGDTAADLDYLSTAALALNGGTIQDAATNNASLTLPAPGAAGSLGANKAIVIDTTTPTTTSFTRQTPATNPTNADTLIFRVTFSEPVTGVGPTDFAVNGATSATVTGVSAVSPGGPFDVTVSGGDLAGFNGGVGLDFSGAMSITDPAGNPVASTEPATDETYTLDNAGPTVTTVTSTAADGFYTTGAVIPVTVTFSEAVTVTGTPQLTLETGATDRVVNYSSGSGTATLTFNYTVQAGDTSADLDYLAAASLALNGGTIRDALTNNASLTLPAPGAAGSLGFNKDIVIDATPPAVTNITSTAANGSYGTGAVIPVTITFSEAVTVTGTPQLTLETGAINRVINYSSGSGTNTLTFNYTTQPGDTSPDLDYVATNSLALNGGTIRDAALNNASLTLPAPGAAGSLGFNKNIVIDATEPAVTNVTSTAANGSYSTGAVIPITITFSEAVTVTGTPQLTLETGGTDAVVNYSSGSGTATLTFNYTVQAGDTSTDLDYVAANSLALNGGTIQDTSGNNATLTLPAPGAAGSLGANRAIVIDTVGPDTTITANPPNPSTSANASFSFTGSDPGGSGVASFQCQLDGGGFSACTSPRTYTGLSDGSHTFQVGAVDAAGNTDSTPASYTWTIDTTPPPAPVVITPANGGNTNNPQPLVSGTAEVSSTVTVFLDGVSAGTTTADAAGSWTFTPPNPLSDGAHTVRARATDAVGNTSVDSNTNTFTVDTVAPTVTLTSAAPDPTNTSPMPVTVTFSESVTGFISSDIVPGNATVSNFAGSGSTYTFDLIPTGLGLVTADIAAGVAQDAAGNPNIAASQFSRTFVGPEIAVLGNNIVIPDGDTSPSLTDETDFGSVVLGGAITRTFTISNSGNLALTLSGSPLVALSGPAAADFSVVASPVTPVAANTSTTFQVRFAPSVAGTSVATVTLANNDSDENPYTFVVAGAGSSSSPGNTPIYLPLLFKNAVPAPDLVIDSLTAGSSGVTLVIRNAGTVPVVDAFWLDVYFNPTSTPTLNKPWQDIASHGQVWGIQGAALPLDPGESLTLISGDAYYFPQFSSSLPLPVGANVFALADSVDFSTSYGAVRESNEGNNLSGPVISTAGSGTSRAGQADGPSLEGLPPR